MRDEAAEALRSLYETVERLRAPGGCPWDREQTHRSLRPYLLEETYEVLEAIDADDAARLREELGDLLLQVCMHSVIAGERRDAGDGFDIGDVAEATRRKMIHRHPHVFGDVEVDGAADVVVNWERLKAAEKRTRLSLLDGVPRALPALAYALGVQKRPARVGFDPIPDVEAALAAVERALSAVRTVAVDSPEQPRGADWPLDGGGDGAGGAEPGEGAAATASPRTTGSHSAGPPPAPRVVEEAIGEVLFAVVALARRLRVNPEDALRWRAERFAAQFRAVEEQARADGISLHDLPPDEWQRRWASVGDEPNGDRPTRDDARRSPSQP